MSTAAVRISDAAVVRGGSPVWHDVSLTVAPGEFAALLGPNGAGKSTLLHVLLGLMAPSAGVVTVFGERPDRVRERIGYLPQRHGFDAATRIRGLDLVRLGLNGARWGLPLPLGSRRARSEARVREVIDLVGASGYARRPMGELSGGEQQRLLIAQALVGRPGLLLLDEPLDSLDLPTQTAVAALLARICRDEGVAVLLVAHDVNPVLGALDRVLYLAAGRGVEGPPSEIVTASTLSALYGAPIEVLRAGDGRLVVVGQPEGTHAHVR